MALKKKRIANEQKSSSSKEKPSSRIFFGKKMIAIRLDNAVLSFFKATGRGWQTKINAILKEWMERQ